MVTTEYTQGKHKIKIESAETLEDAKKNGFPDGVYVRHYVDDKIVTNYITMMRFIAEEASSNNSKLIPNEKDLMKTRNEMLNNQAKMMSESLENLKKQYGQAGIPGDILEKVFKQIDKLNPMGIRTEE